MHLVGYLKKILSFFKVLMALRFSGTPSPSLYIFDSEYILQDVTTL
jgi:hypothetical protein